MGSAPSLGWEPPGSGAVRIPFLTAFTIDFLRFEVHLSCSFPVLRRERVGNRPMGVQNRLGRKKDYEGMHFSP